MGQLSDTHTVSGAGGRGWPGPFIGGSSLGKGNDFSETGLRSLTERDSPSTAEKSLRSSIEIAKLYRTTSADLSFENGHRSED